MGSYSSPYEHHRNHNCHILDRNEEETVITNSSSLNITERFPSALLIQLIWDGEWQVMHNCVLHEILLLVCSSVPPQSVDMGGGGCSSRSMLRGVCVSVLSSVSPSILEPVGRLAAEAKALVERVCSPGTEDGETFHCVVSYSIAALSVPFLTHLIHLFHPQYFLPSDTVLTCD